MADGVNTGAFVPTQPAIVDTSAAFTRLLNVAQRQQERETAMMLADQQRRQKQMEAQLDIINGFDASKMVADDRMMFNDAINQLRMDFVEGKINDPMEFRGRVGKLRNYYNQFTQYAQNPETLAMRDNMMKVSYYPSELNKANEELGPGRRYVTDEAIYNDRVNRFEHPLSGRQYEVTPDGTILAKTEQGLVPVDALPREGAALFQVPDEFNAEGLTIEAIAAPLRTGIAQVRSASNYIGMTYESNLMGTQDGRASMVGDFIDNRGGFGAFDDLVEAHITGGRSAVNSLIASQEENRGREMSRAYDEFLDYSNQEWDKAMRSMLPKVTTSKTTTEKQQKRSKLLGSGVYLPRFTYYDPTKDPRLDGTEAQATVINNGMEFGIQGGLDIPLEGAFGAVEGMTVEPVSITFFKGGEYPVLRYANTDSGELERLAINPDQYSIINRYLDEEFGVTFDELRTRASQLYPKTADTDAQQPTREYPLLSAAPGEQMPTTISLSVEEPKDTLRIQSTVTPVDTTVGLTEAAASKVAELQARKDSLEQTPQRIGVYSTPKISEIRNIEREIKQIESESGVYNEEELDKELKFQEFRTTGPQAPVPEGMEDVLVNGRSKIKNTYRFNDVVMRVRDWENAKSNPEFRRALVNAGFLTVPSASLIDRLRKESRQQEIIAKVVKEMNLPTVDV